MEQLQGRTAVVTGGASGMGRAFARRFAAAGMNIVLGDVDEGGMEAVAAEIRDLGGAVVCRRTDVRNRADVAGLAEAAIAAFDQVNVVCNNAGVAGSFLGGGPIDLADWAWVMDVNFWGVVYGHDVFLPLLARHGDGHIVNTASMAGHFPGHSAYTASKWAVVGITEGLFHSLAEAGSSIGVSCLCPGWVRTNISDSMHRRPEDVAPGPQLEPDATAAARREMVKAFIEGGLDPDHVANLVHDAVVARQFWIFTHLDMVSRMPARYESILSGTNPQRIIP